MLTHGELRIEPSPETLAQARQWLAPVRAALGSDFLAAYLTGSVLTQSFDAKQSRINLLVVARTLDTDVLERIAPACQASAAAKDANAGIDPLFLSRRQVEHSIDVFPIEWLEIHERHLLLEGEDLVAALEVPAGFLRLQCEHELRGKHIRLRQTYLLAHDRPEELERVVRGSASGFATLFRTLLRLRGETPPGDSAKVIQRLADVYGLDATGVLGPQLMRYSPRRYKSEEILALYRKFLVEMDRLVNAIDEMHVS